MLASIDNVVIIFLHANFTLKFRQKFSNVIRVFQALN